MRALGIDIGGSSIKACLIGAGERRYSQSARYAGPSRELLAGAIRSAVGDLGDTAADTPVGLCLPGKRHASGDSIVYSMNLPCLNGWRFDNLLLHALGSAPARFGVVTDAHAAAHDWFCAHKPVGRTACIAIGTGVGLCVLDEGEPVGFGARGIGRLGLMDVGRLKERDTVAHDGATNTLESYVGAGALRRRLGEAPAGGVEELLAEVGPDDPFMRAMVRALRVVHAIYTPDTIVLLGGVGIALAPRGDELRDAVARGLTTLAASDWRLRFGDSIYHAASGAALLTAAGA